ncbi:MAG: tRNA guanosine(34) transglycosylase Tgt, partial [Candidatus Omnitrophota bacterium]
MFELIKQDKNSRARLGKLTTEHGVINTPAFMPVGTHATIKGLYPKDVE